MCVAVLSILMPIFFFLSPLPFNAFVDHEALETMFHTYTEHRFQWHFSYWLFKQLPPFNHQLRAIFLQWRKHHKRKVSKWGTPTCDVEYLASLHPITADYWKGRLAHGDETAGELCLAKGSIYIHGRHARVKCSQECNPLLLKVF